MRLNWSLKDGPKGGGYYCRWKRLLLRREQGDLLIQKVLSITAEGEEERGNEGGVKVGRVEYYGVA